MIGFVVAVAVFGLLAVFVLRLADADLEKRGGLGMVASISLWLLYLFHADTVAAAAFTDVGRIDAPAAPFMASGLLLASAGWLLFLAATVSLVRHGDFKGLNTTQLVMSGPFRLSRHPQNAGWAMLLLGFAIASRSLVALALVAVFALFAGRFARIEERHLARRFGTAYASYRDRTPVFLTLPGAR